MPAILGAGEHRVGVSQRAEDGVHVVHGERPDTANEGSHDGIGPFEVRHSSAHFSNCSERPGAAYPGKRRARGPHLLDWIAEPHANRSSACAGGFHKGKA